MTVKRSSPSDRLGSANRTKTKRRPSPPISRAPPSPPLPVPARNIAQDRIQDFETLCTHIPIPNFLKVAKRIRGGEQACRFGEYHAGVYNFVIFIHFSDGVDWIIKFPRLQRDETDDEAYLVSECATLKALETVDEFRDIPAPRVIAAKFNKVNEMRTAYLIMTKAEGRELKDALHEMDEGQITTFIKDLAAVSKALRSKPFDTVMSYTFSKEADMGKEPQEGIVLDIQNHCTWLHHGSDDEIFGPHSTALEYNEHLLKPWWGETCLDGSDLYSKWKIKAFMSHLLCELAKPPRGEDEQFFLSHPDLHAGNIFVDEEGHISGIIDWEFAASLPPMSGSHYPVLFTRLRAFDSRDECKRWRGMYEAEFEEDDSIRRLFEYLDQIVCLETILFDEEIFDPMNRLIKVGLLESEAELERLGPCVKFPWKGKERDDTF